MAFDTEPGGQDPRDPPEIAELQKEFPQFELIELLGAGGMGVVYKARQIHLDRLVAFKILPVDPHRDPAFAERFAREAKALAKLNHPGIVTLYEFGQGSRHYFFVMEYVDGMNLRQLLKVQSIAPGEALALVIQVCAALQFAHDEGVVHRDIKPENILINRRGQAKIADFGLAKILGVAPDVTLTGNQSFMGTLYYMAPEQREKPLAVDHRADIYSLGVVLYELLTGELPIGRFAPPSRKVQVDFHLDQVVLRALEKEPELRYQKASEVKTAIESVPSAEAPEQLPSAASARSNRPPKRMQEAALVLIFMLLLASALWWFLRHPGPSPASALPAPPVSDIVYQTCFSAPTFHPGSIAGQDGWIITSDKSPTAASITSSRFGQILEISGARIEKAVDHAGYGVRFTRPLDLNPRLAGAEHVRLSADVQFNLDPSAEKFGSIFTGMGLYFANGPTETSFIMDKHGGLFSQTDSPNQHDVTGSGHFPTNGFHNLCIDCDVVHHRVTHSLDGRVYSIASIKAGCDTSAVFVKSGLSATGPTTTTVVISNLIIRAYSSSNELSFHL